MNPVSDLIRDSKLEANFHEGHTLHIYYVSGGDSRQRKLRKEEYWERCRNLGTGAFGTVWLERLVRSSDEKYRAVKEIRKSTQQQSGAVDYGRELEAIAKFSHRKYEMCFVKSFGWYENSENVFIAMEYFPLGDLQNFLLSPLPERDVQQIVSQVLEGLLFMHDNGFAHRDLKPTNILVKSKGPDWWVKIGDFGISKRAEDGLTALRTFSGTFGFLAPEILAQHGLLDNCDFNVSMEYTVAVDIWSLGEIAFRALTGEQPFPIRSLKAYVKGTSPFPAEKMQALGASKEGCNFLNSLMAPMPKDRLTARDALAHPWIGNQKPSSTRVSIEVALPTTEEAISSEDLATEASARWTTVQTQGHNNEATDMDEGEEQFWTAEAPDDSAVEMLLKKGADTNVENNTGAKNDLGRIALYQAAYDGHERTALALLEKGAKPDTKDKFRHAARNPVEENGPTGVLGLLSSSEKAENRHPVTVQPSNMDSHSVQAERGLTICERESVDNYLGIPDALAASVLPLRLLGYIDGNFFVFDLRDSAYMVNDFYIVSHLCGELELPHNCGIEGVNWNVTISRQKLEDIKRLMISSGVQFMWLDCLCINMDDMQERSAETAKIPEYYRSARMCFIQIDMPEMWYLQDIVDNLKFIDHILSHMGGAALASEAMLSEDLANRLSAWANNKWTFALDKSTVRSAAIDMGVLNCYSTCISYVMSLFNCSYFQRVWTFQEMLLGKNITMWGINGESISCIGNPDTWMDLVTDSKDKAYKLQAWIMTSRVLRTTSANAILRVIEKDLLSLDSLQKEVRGISSARTDIINGGPHWWHENYKGISNVFSVVSIRPRSCALRGDIFRGLLDVFSGLFTAEEIAREMMGDDIERISFAFFKQLSIKTRRAWTKLAISSGEKEEWDWISAVTNDNRLLTTDYFAGVVNLGRLKQNGLVETTAITGISGYPRGYIKISFNRGNRGFQFVFKGCNCGKEVKTGVFSSKPIPIHDQLRNVARDETGKILVQCATILGSIIDPGRDVVEYRRTILRKLQPYWNTSDPNAKPTEWIDRCVSGTDWENPKPSEFRVHNMSMNYRIGEITGCGSRLENENTASISCTVLVNCGCTIVAPFSLIFEAITAVEGSSLGSASVSLEDDRINSRDGLGLVQVEDVGRAFNMVAFGGDIDSYKSHSHSCRSTAVDKPVAPKLVWPTGRALVREGFKHTRKDVMRDYGYVETGGSGNLLICRLRPKNQYKIIGVCIDEFIANRKGRQMVTIQ